MDELSFYLSFQSLLQVCSTIIASATPTSSPRQRRQADNTTMDGTSGSGLIDTMETTTILSYLDRPVQFIVMRIGNDSTNSAPRLVLPTQPILVTEDLPLQMELEYEDDELDLVDFELLTISRLGNVSLSPDGILTFDPCRHCTGSETIAISIQERPIGENHTPLEDFAELILLISNTDDQPLLHFYSSSNMGHDDNVVEDRIMNAYIDSNRVSPAVVATVAAFDFDGYDDDLELGVLQDGQSGRAGFQKLLDAVSVYESLPATLAFPSPELLQFRGYVTFLASHVTYLPLDSSFIGNDTVTIFVRDSRNIVSETLQITIEVLPSSCLNDGVCGGSDADPLCEDVAQRRRGFDGYNCSCLPGFTGAVCEVALSAPEPPPSRGERVKVFSTRVQE